MLWVKAFHIIAVICWFAGLFYLPRLFVYHCLASEAGDHAGIERFKIMERKLYRGIMMPSMAATVALGGWLLVERWDSYFSTALWMHLKLSCAMLLVAYHFTCGAMVQTFARDANRRSHKFYRVFNELPVFLLVAMVLLAVLKAP